MSASPHAVLAALADGPVPGSTLAADLDLTPAVVQDHLEAIDRAGFTIQETSEGYDITTVPEYGDLALAYDLPAPFTIEYHETIGSTNDRARSLASDGHRNVVVAADAQTSGRGRRDREWASPPGGIWMSIVLDPALPPNHRPVLTLAAAVATVRAIEETGVRVGVKWPNDVLVRDTEEKLAGILTEAAPADDGDAWVVIGIGINANVDRPHLPPGATSLHATVGEVHRRDIVHRLLRELDALRHDPTHVLEAWRAISLTLDRNVRIDTPTTRIEGRALDVELPGSLVVATEEGRVRVDAGDCEHLRPV